MLTIIWKILKLILKIIANVLVFSGLWIATLFTIGFFVAFLIQGWYWNDVSLYYYLGLGACVVLGFLWFCYFKLGIGRKKKKKG